MGTGTQYTGTGRRKNSIARVRLVQGTGQVIINKRPADTYFPRESYRMLIHQPFESTSTVDQFDVFANVHGGGTTGQAGAIRHGIAKALLEVDAEYRPRLRKAGFLTRDPRAKERKKYGQPGARKKFQFSKR